MKLGKIFTATCKDTGRAVIGNVKLATGRATATDGYILAVKPVDYTGPDCLIPQATAKAIGMGASRKGNVIECNGHSISVNGVVYPVLSEDKEGRYPEIDQILNCEAKATAEVITLCINAGYLKRLADAITSDGEITLRILPGKDGAEVLKPIYATGNEGEGVIMPIRL